MPWRSVASAIFVALALRALVIAWLRPPSAWDGQIYAALAESIAKGHGYAHWDGSGRATAFFPVGFPAAIALVMSALRCGATVGAWIVNMLASALCVGSAAQIAHRASGPTAAARAAWIVALYPSAALWTAATMTETLQCALVTAALAVAMPTDREPAARAPALVGLLVALAAYVRPQAILLAPVLGALSARSLPQRARHAAIATLAALLVLAPWSLRNARALDGFALVSTNGGSNLLIGTLPEARGGYRPLTERDACGAVRGEVARDRCMSRVAIERIRREPLSWALLSARKLARTMGFEWAPVSYARSTVGQRISKPTGLALAALSTLCWWAMMLAALRFVRRARRDRWRSRPARELTIGLVGALTSTALVHAVFIADDRYHLPIVGVLAAAAACGLTTSPRTHTPEHRPSDT